MARGREKRNDAKILIGVTDAEYALADKLAEGRGMSKSEFFRYLLDRANKESQKPLDEWGQEPLMEEKGQPAPAQVVITPDVVEALAEAITNKLTVERAPESRVTPNEEPPKSHRPIHRKVG